MNNWSPIDNALKAHFVFKDFKTAWAFMTHVAMEAEVMNHHPTWANTYNRVDMSLNTHDAGNIITEKDEKLAKKINAIYTKYKSNNV
jgi:4a-hydroxytetrahydrobiopterin dehydratase